MSAENNRNPRNGWYRDLLNKPLNWMADRIVQHAPGISANHITVAGGIGIGIGAYAAVENNYASTKDFASTMIPISIIVGAACTDAIDGPVARAHQRINPPSHDSRIGQLVDGVTDRASENFLALSRMIQAYNRDDQVGEILALASSLSNITPSLGRALVENNGKVVPEAGTGVLGFFGTRVGRTFNNIIATVYPEIGDVPVQALLDGLTTVANIKTTAERFGYIFDKNIPQTLSPEQISEAKLRAVTLGITAGAIFGTSLATHHLLHRKN